MTQQTSNRSYRSKSILVATGVVLALATAPAGANQVYKACGKKWAKKAAKLPEAQLQWMMKRSGAETSRDLDGDGREDRIVMTSTPSFRTCEVAKDWDQKETTVRIEYANGKTKLFHWINAQMVDGLKLYPAMGRMLVTGADSRGQPFSKWVEYGPPGPKDTRTFLADAGPPASPAAAGSAQK